MFQTILSQGMKRQPIFCFLGLESILHTRPSQVFRIKAGNRLIMGKMTSSYLEKIDCIIDYFLYITYKYLMNRILCWSDQTSIINGLKCISMVWSSLPMNIENWISMSIQLQDKCIQYHWRQTIIAVAMPKQQNNGLYSVDRNGV